MVDRATFVDWILSFHLVRFPPVPHCSMPHFAAAIALSPLLHSYVEPILSFSQSYILQGTFFSRRVEVIFPGHYRRRTYHPGPGVLGHRPMHLSPVLPGLSLFDAHFTVPVTLLPIALYLFYNASSSFRKSGHCHGMSLPRVHVSRPS